MNFVIGGSAGHSSHWSLSVDEGEFSPEKFGGLEKWSTKLSPLEEAKEFDRIAKSQERAADRKEKTAITTAEDTATIQDYLSQTPNLPGCGKREIRLALHWGDHRMSRAIDLGLAQMLWCETAIIKPNRKTPYPVYKLISSNTQQPLF